MRKNPAILTCLLLLTLMSGLAAAQAVSLISIDVGEGKVELKADGPFTYTVYKPSDPYLVVIEIPGVVAGSLKDRIAPEKGGVSEIRVSEIGPASAGSKVEILFDSPNDVEPVYSENTLTLNIKEAAPAAKRPVRETVTTETGSEKPAEKAVPERVLPPRVLPVEKPVQTVGGETLPEAKEIRDVNFAVEDGRLNLVIKADGSMKPTVFSLENKIVIDIPGVSMKASLPETVVAPIKAVRYGVHKDKVRVVVDLKQKADFEASSAGDSVMIAFRVRGAAPEEKLAEAGTETVEKEAPVMPEEKEAPAEAGYAGKTISLDFQNADIVPIFRLLGDVAGYNTVINPQVSGRITLKLLNVPWEQALDIVLETFNLEKSIDGNILNIAPSGFFAKRKEDVERLREAGVRAEPLIQEVIAINYDEAAPMQAAIENAKLKSARGSITVHTRTNSLIVQDTKGSIEKIKDLIARLDVAKPQVMIEAKIVEVNTDYSQSLGIRWGGSVAGSGVKSFPDTTDADFSVNTPLTSVGGAGGTLNLAIGTAATTQVNLSIEALETVGKTKKLSNPKLLTMDNISASIQQGVSIPVQTTTAAGSTTEFVNANLNLNVTPKITPEGFVQMKVNASNDTPISVGGATGINKQSIQTEALVKNGETLVLGGIYTREDTNTYQGIPYLSKIPIIGWLFKTRTTVNPTKELLIFITPVIVEKNGSGI